MRYKLRAVWRGKNFSDTLSGMNWKWELHDATSTGLISTRVDDGYAPTRKSALRRGARAVKRHQRRLRADHPSADGPLVAYLDEQGRVLE